MNTIERVARGICAQWVSDNYGWDGDIGKDYVDENWTTHENEAKAALEALADGLKWQGNLLFYNGFGVGQVVASGEPPHAGWSANLLGQVEIFTPYAAHEKPGDTESFDKAKSELMSRARHWLMGIEPDGYMG